MGMCSLMSSCRPARGRLRGDWNHQTSSCISVALNILIIVSVSMNYNILEYFSAVTSAIRHSRQEHDVS